MIFDHLKTQRNIPMFFATSILKWKKVCEYLSLNVSKKFQSLEFVLSTEEKKI